MSIGSSGRIVIEVNPELKHLLYTVLEKDGLTLKEWFIRNAKNYMQDAVQPSLFDSEYQPKREEAA